MLPFNLHLLGVHSTQCFQSSNFQITSMFSVIYRLKASTQHTVLLYSQPWEMQGDEAMHGALEANHVFIPCIVVWTLGLPLVWGGWVGWMGAGPCQGLANKSHRRLHTCGSKKHLMPSSLKSPLPKDSDIHASSRPEGPAGETWYSLSKHWLHSNQCPALFVVQSLFHVLSNGFCCAGGRSHCFKQKCTSKVLSKELTSKCTKSQMAMAPHLANMGWLYPI